MVVRKEHGTEMEDVLIMHFIAKTDTNGRGRIASVMATARGWAELHTVCNNMVRPHIIDERYRFANKQAVPFER